MHREALNHIDLCCTACCRFEGEIVQHRLDLIPAESSGDYVISGRLKCPSCGQEYPVSGGVPCLMPVSEPDDELNARYLDAHYGDINEDYWHELRAGAGAGLCLDAGCSVGRHTFDCAADGFAVGIDVNLGQLQLAAAFQRAGEISFRRRTRAMAFEEVASRYLPAANVLFVLADVNNPPFRMHSFDYIAALNLVDTVKRPLTALGQLDAMLKPGGSLQLASPYIWDTAFSEDWLETGDTDSHTFMRELLTGKRVPEAGFSYRIIREKRSIPWLIRRQDSSHFKYFVDLILAGKS